VADITYVYTKEGRLYLATVMDLFSLRIIGWAKAPTPYDKRTCDVSFKQSVYNSRT
ncbi:IS3 family transposase, partial [Staphylococcus pseudintermedius]